jgi:NUMOD1 domain.
MARKFRWRHNRDIEKDILDGMGDINSREELMAMAREEGLEGEVINWSKWDEVVQQTKELIEALGEMLPVSPTREVWVYTTVTGTLVGHYGSVKEAAEALNEPPGTIQHCCYKNTPLQRAGLVFSYYPLTWKEVCQKANGRITNYAAGKPKERWVYSEDGKYLGHFNSTEEVAKAFGITRSSVNYYVFKDRPYHKYNLIIRDRPMEDK